jgi:hypothetical protein
LPQWWAVLAIVAAAWLIAGHALWLSSSLSVSDAANAVLRIAGEGR